MPKTKKPDLLVLKALLSMPLGPTPLLYMTHEEIEEERAKLLAEATERAGKLAPATVEEQVEFVKKVIALGCEKYIG